MPAIADFRIVSEQNFILGGAPKGCQKQRKHRSHYGFTRQTSHGIFLSSLRGSRIHRLEKWVNRSLRAWQDRRLSAMFEEQRPRQGCAFVKGTTMTCHDQGAYLIFDIETIPDGNLIAEVKYPDLTLTPHDAVVRLQDDTRASSPSGSDFLPLTFHVPVAVCVLRVDERFRLQSLTCLDVPQYRPREIATLFWRGVQHYKAALVSFNGRKFDIPVMELSAYRFGLSLPWHYKGDKDGAGSRHRYGGRHIDLYEFFSNFNAHQVPGGLNLLARLIGAPGKFEMHGSNVYQMIQAGRAQAVNEYCAFDVLDTYFVFLRTRVLQGDINLEQEEQLRQQGQSWLRGEAEKQTFLHRYLAKWDEAIVSRAE
jgi:predicted PolB exonuclease-like 3'-5' exonuclease